MYFTREQASAARRIVVEMTSTSSPVYEIAAAVGRSPSWVSQTRFLMMGSSNRRPIPIPKGNRADVVLAHLTRDEIEVLRKAAEARMTSVVGLAAALLKTIANEPSLVDAILDDEE